MPSDDFFDVLKLVCYGCAHSAACVEYPSKPSGERPCCFCIRNKDREEWLLQAQKEHPDWFNGERAKEQGKDYNPFTGHWYDGSPAIKVPMDCYHSLDYQIQITKWLDEAEDK